MSNGNPTGPTVDQLTVGRGMHRGFCSASFVEVARASRGPVVGTVDPRMTSMPASVSERYTSSRSIWDLRFGGGHGIVHCTGWSTLFQLSHQPYPVDFAAETNRERSAA